MNEGRVLELFNIVAAVGTDAYTYAVSNTLIDAYATVCIDACEDGGTVSCPLYGLGACCADDDRERFHLLLHCILRVSAGVSVYTSANAPMLSGEPPRIQPARTIETLLARWQSGEYCRGCLSRRVVDGRMCCEHAAGDVGWNLNQ